MKVVKNELENTSKRYAKVEWSIEKSKLKYDNLLCRTRCILQENVMHIGERRVLSLKRDVCCSLLLYTWSPKIVLFITFAYGLKITHCFLLC